MCQATLGHRDTAGTKTDKPPALTLAINQIRLVVRGKTEAGVARTGAHKHRKKTGRKCIKIVTTVSGAGGGTSANWVTCFRRIHPTLDNHYVNFTPIKIMKAQREQPWRHMIMVKLTKISDDEFS